MCQDVARNIIPQVRHVELTIGQQRNPQRRSAYTCWMCHSRDRKIVSLSMQQGTARVIKYLRSYAELSCDK